MSFLSLRVTSVVHNDRTSPIVTARVSMDIEEWFCSSCPVKVKNTGPTCILCGAEPSNGSETDLKAAGVSAESKAWGTREKKLHQDAKDGRTQDVISHITSGIDVNVQDPLGETALMQASYWGHTKVIKHLIDANANVNHIGWKEGWTALHRAAKSSELGAVEALIKAGADVTILSHAGQRAFDVAGAFRGSAAIPIKKLLSAELQRWVSSQLEECKLPSKAVDIVLKYHCPNFQDEVLRANQRKWLKEAEQQHKTEDKIDAAQEAQRELNGVLTRQEFNGEQFHMGRLNLFW
ncbi:hypothetical protein AAMO2058_001686300 [Amorphochlora amoebiformis]